MSDLIGMSYNQKAIRIGTIAMICSGIANFAPALYVYLVYGIMPPAGDVLKIWAVLAVTFGVSWLVQPITYFSLLGVSGSYLGWIAGSNADIRCPSATMAQKAANVEPSTPEGDVISTIGVAGSIITSVIMVTIFVFVGQGILDVLPPFIQHSFKYVLTAVFGAVYVQLACKNLGMGAWTIIFAIVTSYLWELVQLPGWLLNIFIIVGGVIIARVYFNLSIKNPSKQN